MHANRALTEFYGLLLIVVLIGVAAVLILSTSGSFAASLLQKPPAFAVRAEVMTPYPSRSVISLYHLAGDSVALSNQSSSGIFFTLESPDGKKITVYPSPVMTGNPWARGGTVIIYSDGSRFLATDDFVTLITKNGPGVIAGIPPGIWIIYLTDQRTHVVVNSLEVTV